MPTQQPVLDDGHARSSEGILHAEDAGYHKGLKSRQIQMIALGGAIGTGLFLGAGGRLAAAGPSLFIAYAICGVFAFLILRGPRGARASQGIVRVIRLLRPGVLRGEDCVRVRLVLLDPVGDQRRGRHHGRSPLLNFFGK
jgi:hypothetical protein